MIQVPKKFTKGSPEYFLYRLFEEKSFYKWYEWPDPEQKLLDMAGEAAPHAKRLLELAQEEAQKPDHEGLVGLELQRTIRQIILDKIFVRVETKAMATHYITTRLVPVAMVYRQFLETDFEKFTRKEVSDYYEQASIPAVAKMLGLNEKIAADIKNQISGFGKSTYSKHKIEGIRFCALVLVEVLDDSEYIVQHWPNTAKRWWTTEQEEGAKALATQEKPKMSLMITCFAKVKGQWQWITHMFEGGTQALKGSPAYETMQRIIQRNSPQLLSPAQI